MKLPPIIEVVWLDIHGLVPSKTRAASAARQGVIQYDNSWQKRDKAVAAKPIECVSVGYLLVWNSEVVTLTRTVAEDTDCDSLCIPMDCVRLIRWLVPSKTRAASAARQGVIQ